MKPTTTPPVVVHNAGGVLPITYQCIECLELIDEADLKETDWFIKHREEEDSVCPYCESEVVLYEPDDFNGHETQEERKGDR